MNLVEIAYFGCHNVFERFGSMYVTLSETSFFKELFLIILLHELTAHVCLQLIIVVVPL